MCFCISHISRSTISWHCICSWKQILALVLRLNMERHLQPLKYRGCRYERYALPFLSCSTGKLISVGNPSDRRALFYKGRICPRMEIACQLPSTSSLRAQLLMIASHRNSVDKRLQIPGRQFSRCTGIIRGTILKRMYRALRRKSVHSSMRLRSATVSFRCLPHIQRKGKKV